MKYIYSYEQLWGCESFGVGTYTLSYTADKDALWYAPPGGGGEMMGDLSYGFRTLPHI